MNKTETLERLKELKISLINQQGDNSLWGTLIGVLTDMHVEELKENSKCIGKLHVEVEAKFKNDEFEIDWQEECGRVTKQHDEALMKNEIWVKSYNSISKSYIELSSEHKKIKKELDRYKSLDIYNIDKLENKLETMTEGYKAECANGNNLVKKNEKLERQLKALSLIKHVSSTCEGVEQYEIMGQPLEDYIDEHERMEEVIKTLGEATCQWSRDYETLQNKFNSLNKGYKIRGDELDKYHDLYNDVVEKNKDLQHYANIGRVLKWYNTKSTEEAVLLHGGRMPRSRKFEIMFDHIQTLYRRDKQNEAF